MLDPHTQEHELQELIELDELLEDDRIHEDRRKEQGGGWAEEIEYVDPKLRRMYIATGVFADARA